MGFLKFLFIAILVLWLLRMVVRLLFPYLLRKASERVMSQAGQQYQYRQQNGAGFESNHRQQRQPQGEITIDYVPTQKKTKEGPKKAGEFVDFEEIK